MNKWELDKKRKGSLPLYQYYHRKLTMSPSPPLIVNYFNILMFKIASFLYKCEIPPSVQIGEGLLIGHPYCITINGTTKIGRNCSIHKGVTVGQENRGKRKGSPTIGNEVWIGVNATIVGNVRIGDDVLIAPNAYVNCDVPSHSIVIGNPCVIKPCINATAEYINNKI